MALIRFGLESFQMAVVPLLELFPLILFLIFFLMCQYLNEGEREREREREESLPGSRHISQLTRLTMEPERE